MRFLFCICKHTPALFSAWLQQADFFLYCLWKYIIFFRHLMNLDNIKGSKKAELEITPSRELLAKQADNSTQNCRATKGVLSFQHCVLLKCLGTWEWSSMGLSPLCGRILYTQGDAGKVCCSSSAHSGSLHGNVSTRARPCPGYPCPLGAGNDQS